MPLRFKHPCPNCAALRSGPRSSCGECGYPSHARTEVRFAPLKIKPFQFSLPSLISAITIAALLLAIFESVEFEVAIIFAFILFPILNFLDQFRENLRQQAQIDRQRLEPPADPFAEGEPAEPTHNS